MTTQVVERVNGVRIVMDAPCAPAWRRVSQRGIATPAAMEVVVDGRTYWAPKTSCVAYGGTYYVKAWVLKPRVRDVSMKWGHH